MATIAEALGIEWGDDITRAPQYRLTYHAQKQAAAKGWTSEDVLRAANEPLHTSRCVRVPGQRRHVRGNIVTVVDPATRRVITCYEDRVETDLRDDQQDSDALRYATKRARRKTLKNR